MKTTLNVRLAKRHFVHDVHGKHISEYHQQGFTVCGLAFTLKGKGNGSDTFSAVLSGNPVTCLLCIGG